MYRTAPSENKFNISAEDSFIYLTNISSSLSFSFYCEAHGDVSMMRYNKMCIIIIISLETSRSILTAGSFQDHIC